SLVDETGCIASCDVCEQHRVLARVVGRGRGRIASVIGGEDQQVVRLQRLEQIRKAPVEILKAAMEVDRVVPMSPERVRLDEVHEDEAGLELPQELLGLLDSLDIRLRG